MEPRARSEERALPPLSPSFGKTRDAAVDFLRWLALLGVLFVHSAFAGRYDGVTLSRLATLRQVFGWCVLFFFFASGYFTRPELPWRLHARRRALRLLPPYVIASGLSFLALRIASALHLTTALPSLQAVDLLRGLVTLHGVGPQLYFLPYLFLTSLGVLALAKWFGALRALALVGVVAIGIWSLRGLPSGTTGAETDRIPLYVLAYAAGLAVRQTRGRASWYLATAAVVTMIVGVILVAVGLPGGPLIHLTVPYWLWQLIRIKTWVPPTLSLPGSGAVYLWHAPILLPAFTILWQRLGVDDMANFACACVCTVIVCLAIDWGARRSRLDGLLTL